MATDIEQWDDFGVGDDDDIIPFSWDAEAREQHETTTMRLDFDLLETLQTETNWIEKNDTKRNKEETKRSERHFPAMTSSILKIAANDLWKQNKALQKGNDALQKGNEALQKEIEALQKGNEKRRTELCSRLRSITANKKNSL